MSSGSPRGQRAAMSPEPGRALQFLNVTPRRRAWIVVLLSFATAAVLIAAADIGFEVTIGGAWSHNRAFDACAATPSTRSISNRAESISVRDRWNWWLPGHSHKCVYEMPNG